MKKTYYRLRYNPKKGNEYYGKRKYLRSADAREAQKKAYNTGKYQSVYIA